MSNENVESKSSFLSKKPHRIFILDGVGALISAFFLGVLLVKFQSIFGMPKQSLYILAFWPCLFAIYDLASYFFSKDKWKMALKGIAIANILYCILSAVFLFLDKDSLTGLGWAYFLIEILIVLILAIWELKLAKS